MIQNKPQSKQDKIAAKLSQGIGLFFYTVKKYAKLK